MKKARMEEVQVILELLANCKVGHNFHDGLLTINHRHFCDGDGFENSITGQVIAFLAEEGLLADVMHVPQQWDWFPYDVPACDEWPAGTVYRAGSDHRWMVATEDPDPDKPEWDSRCHGKAAEIPKYLVSAAGY